VPAHSGTMIVVPNVVPVVISTMYLDHIHTLYIQPCTTTTVLMHAHSGLVYMGDK
jgi:hypothetical protein